MKENQFLEVALGAVKKAEPVFRKYFGRAGGVLHKDDSYQSPVTDVDREIEAIIISELSKNFPDHSISGEELPVQKKPGPYTWYIDPIDGTANYIRALPACSISLALWEGNSPLVGVVSDPINDVVYSAIQGKGAFKNRMEKLSVSKTSKLSDSVGNAGRAKAAIDDKALERVAGKAHRNREYGSSALQLCYMAEGKMDFYVSERIKTYDMAASALVLSEAGGKVTDWQGNVFSPLSRQLVASNGKIHQEIIDALKQ